MGKNLKGLYIRFYFPTKTLFITTRTTGLKVHRKNLKGLNLKGLYIRIYFSTKTLFYNYENHGTQGPPEKPQGFIYKVLFSFSLKTFSITLRNTGRRETWDQGPTGKT